MAIDKKEIEKRVKPVLEKLQAGRLDEALSLTRKILYLGGERTVHGTPVPYITKIGEEIGTFGREHPDLVIPFLVKLWHTRGREERFSVGHGFGEIGKKHYQKVLPVMYECLADVQWEALEAMAWGVGKMVIAHPDEVLPHLREWARDDNHWVRKAVSHSMVIFLNRTKTSRLDDILGMMDILIKDDHPEVRKSIGFVLRQVSRKAPQRVVAFFSRWVGEEDQYIRWNIANGSRNLGKEVLPILKELARDGRKFVRRASASALKDIARKHEEVVKMLEEWQHDTDAGVGEAAATALGYVRK
jgi:3-methyladenine DNA glycosylase AlkD